MSETVKETIILDPAEILSFCGPKDQNIRLVQDSLKANVLARGNEIIVSGEEPDVRRGMQVIEDLLKFYRKAGVAPTPRQITIALRDAEAPETGREPMSSVFLDGVSLPSRTGRVAPMTRGQKRYLDFIRKNDVVFAIGPAGTGKTYLAVAMAVWHLVEGRVRRIILVRPAVEAGEKLGFLPGDIAAKFDPFVRPLYDALYDMMDPDKVKAYLETGVIEVAPLAFMRGRTLNSAFVILDEGQNTTSAQMKMFLTRLGADSKAVVTGDVTQIDLPAGSQSGLIHAQKVLRNVPGIKFTEFTREDVVRHELVQRIVHAYETFSRRKGAS